MAAVKNTHLTIAERQIIETGITNGSTKAAIAQTIGKDKSTIGKEIKEHRIQTYKCRLPRECRTYKSCRHGRECIDDCIDYVPFACKRRDRSPGACNGCSTYSSCHFDKFRYSASDAHHDYRTTLTDSRIGINATVEQVRKIGNIIKPLLVQGQSLYVILENHPEINLSEKTLYSYIENGVFQDAGISITCMDLKRQIRRRIHKDKKTRYSPRKDRTYLKGRTHADYLEYSTANPLAKLVQMDTVYNNVSQGPFIQTFKFITYDLLFCVYHEKKDTDHMRSGILLLEEILGRDLFEKEVEVILTDRGSEFTLSDETEIRKDGSRRTRIFYCDPMASNQKASLENVHLLLREVCPKNCDLAALGFNSQIKANLISSHINSYPKEKLGGKTSFQVLEFFSADTARKFYDYGLTAISPDQVILKPYLLKE